MGGGSPQPGDAPDTGAHSGVPTDAPETGKTYGETVDAAAAAAAASGSATGSASASRPAAAAPVRPERPAFGEYATPEEQRAAIRVPFDTEEGVPVVADADTPVAPVDHDGHAASSPASYGERVAGAQRPSSKPSGQDAPSAAGPSGSSKPARSAGRGGNGPVSGNGSGTGNSSGSANGKQAPGGFFANAFGGGSSAAATADGSAGGVAPARRDRLITYLLLAFGLLAVLNSVSGISALPVSVKQAFEQMNVTATPPTDLLITLGWITAGIHAVMWVVALLWSLSAIRRGKLSWWIPVLCGVIFVVVATVVIFAGFATDPTIMDAVMQRG